MDYKLKTHQTMKTRVCEAQVSRLEYWHAAWERDHQDLVSHPSFILTEENEKFSEILCREPRFEDALIMLEMYGFCEHMILILSWYKKKFVNRFTEEDLLGEYLLPINAHNERYQHERYELVRLAWEVLTDDHGQAHRMGLILTKFDMYQKLVESKGRELSKRARETRKNPVSQWKDRKCKCKTTISL